MTADLTELQRVAAELPPELVRKMIEYATLLKQWAEKPPHNVVGWTDEDYQEATAASMRYYDQLYPEDEGYGDRAPAR